MGVWKAPPENTPIPTRSVANTAFAKLTVIIIVAIVKPMVTGSILALNFVGKRRNLRGLLFSLFLPLKIKTLEQCV